MPSRHPGRARSLPSSLLMTVALVATACAGGGPALSPTSLATDGAEPTVAATAKPTALPTPAFELVRCDAAAGLIDVKQPDPTIASLPITAMIPLPDALDGYAVESAGGSIWISDGIGGYIHRVDPETREIVASIRIPASQDVYLAHDGGTLWATSMQTGTVLPIDMATNRLGDAIAVGRTPLGLAIGPHGPLVVSFEDQMLSEIDPVSGTVRRQVALDPDLLATPDAGPTDIEVIGNDAWVLGHRGRQALRVDLTSFTVAEQRCAEVPSPERMAQGDGVLWISSSKESTVARLDLVTGKIDARVRLPEPATDMRFVGTWEMTMDDAGDLWVAAHSFVARIDTETLKLTAWVDLRDVPADPGAEGTYDLEVVDGRAWIGFSAGAQSQLLMVDVPS